MTTEENKAVVRRFYQAFEANDLAVLEDVLAPELVAYNLQPQNRDEHLQGIRGWHAIFSDNRFEVLDQIAEGDRVASHVIMRCVHSKADFRGVPPFGKQVEIPAVSIERIQHSKIVERHVYSDRLGMLQQLSVLPPG